MSSQNIELYKKKHFRQSDRVDKEAWHHPFSETMGVE